MTTLVGLVTKKGKSSVILGSDRNMTTINSKDDGEVTYREETKSDHQKIYINNDRTAVLGLTGIEDNSYAEFMGRFIEGRFNLKKIIRDRFFPELVGLNMARWEDKEPDSNYNRSFLATRFGEPKLYLCWQLGKVEEKPYDADGSGSQYAIDYLESKSSLISQLTSIEDGINLVASALERASKDIHTNGLDLVILTKKGIYEFGNEIRGAMDFARVMEIERIKMLSKKF